MPNFKKSDGFSLGGDPFTMKKGSKEITTDGSFRKEATDKMGRYGSPLFAIEGRDPRAAGAAYRDTSSDMAEDVDKAQAESKEFKDGKKEKDVKETTSNLENSNNTPKVPKTAEAGDGEGGEDILEKGKEVVKKVGKGIAGLVGLGG